MTKYGEPVQLSRAGTTFVASRRWQASRTVSRRGARRLAHFGEDAMNAVLTIAALVEGATGSLLVMYPPIVIRLLFGAEIAGAGLLVSRIAGISLVALG